MKDAQGNLNELCFVTFSENGAEDTAIDDDFNVLKIKDVLFADAISTASDVTPQPFIEVIPPKDDNSPYMLVFQEV